MKRWSPLVPVLRTLAEADALIPPMLSSTYGGPWVSWYVRALLTPFIGYSDAQYVVARALGPGFDYEAPHYYSTAVTVPRGKRKRSTAGSC